MGAAHAVLAVAILANGALGMALVLVTRLPEHPALLRALLPFGGVGLNRSLTLVLSLLLAYLAFEVYERGAGRPSGRSGASTAAISRGGRSCSPGIAPGASWRF